MKRILGCVVVLLISRGALADEYPTLDRVDHVLTCMREHGGQTVDNLYACSCEIDVIAQEIKFDDFTETRTYEIYQHMPGEKGGVFRDSERGKKLIKHLKAVRADADKRCFVGANRRSASTKSEATATQQRVPVAPPGAHP